MKLKRQKQIRKTLQHFHIKHNIRPPYKIALDGDFLQAALEGKIHIAEQIPKMLGDTNATPFVTRCVVKHLTDQPGKFYDGAASIGRSLRHLKCRHKGIVDPHTCLLSLVNDGNPDRLLMAAQHVQLRNKVRALRNVPIVFIRGRVPILESIDYEEDADRIAKQMLPTPEEMKLIEAVAPTTPTMSQPPRKKKRATSGPNPLSVKKKRKQNPQPPPPPPPPPPDKGADRPDNHVDEAERAHKRRRVRGRRKKTSATTST